MVDVVDDDGSFSGPAQDGGVEAHTLRAKTPTPGHAGHTSLRRCRLRNRLRNRVPADAAEVAVAQAGFSHRVTAALLSTVSPAKVLLVLPAGELSAARQPPLAATWRPQASSAAQRSTPCDTVTWRHLHFSQHPARSRVSGKLCCVGRFVWSGVQVPRSVRRALASYHLARPHRRLPTDSAAYSPPSIRAHAHHPPFTMDLRGMLNDDGNLPPATPKTARQASVASIISPTPPSTAASYTSKPSPAPQASPAPPPKSASVSAPRTPREVPPWARRFDWIALQRGEVRQAHIPERPPPPQQLPISQQPISQKPIGQQPIPRQPSAPPPLDSIGGLEPSLTNVQPYDDVVRKVCDFLWSTVVEREDLHGGVPEGAHPNIKLEIEGKLGTLVDRNTNERVNLPILTQAVSALPTTKLGFESHMNEVNWRPSKQTLRN